MTALKNPTRQRWASLVKELRNEKGLTQSQFGAIFEERVSGQTVSLWEKGTLPSSENLKQIAQLKGWTIDQLDYYLETGQVEYEQKFDPAKVLAELKYVEDPSLIVELIKGATSRLGELAS